MTAIICGLTGGIVTIGFSELLLSFWGSHSLNNCWKLLVAGIALRTVWVLGLLVFVFSSRVLDPIPFTLSLLATYLVAQILEGFRYQHVIRTR